MITSAQGVTGHIIHTYGGGYVFRVYDYTTAELSFVDYDIRHCDLVVKIVDDDAAFYTNRSGRHVLDHSPATLGIAQ